VLFIIIDINPPNSPSKLPSARQCGYPLPQSLLSLPSLLPPLLQQQLSSQASSSVAIAIIVVLAIIAVAVVIVAFLPSCHLLSSHLAISRRVTFLLQVKVSSPPSVPHVAHVSLPPLGAVLCQRKVRTATLCAQLQRLLQACGSAFRAFGWLTSRLQQFSREMHTRFLPRQKLCVIFV
jgi:hypothetical protein